MNKLKKWLIGGIAAAALTSLVFSIAKTSEPQKENKRPALVKELSLKEISWENPQARLEEAFALANPKNLSYVVYDPYLEKSDAYIVKNFPGHSRRLLESYIQSTRQSKHDLGVVSLMPYVGNGQKRPAFARESMISSPSINKIEDLANAIAHEDVHAEEESKGYEFKSSRKKGKELQTLFDEKQIRPEVIVEIGELDAYATQLEAGERTGQKISSMCVTNAATHLYQLSTIIDKALDKGKLTPLEREYAEVKIAKHKETIQKLKN